MMRQLIGLFVLLIPLVYIDNTIAEVVPFALGEWVPYTGENIANHGMATEIVNAACNASGLRGAYSFFPWKRAEKLVWEGVAFGTFPYKEIPERQDRFLFSKTLFRSGFAILTAKNNSKTAGFTYNKPEDLKDFTVGIVAGTNAIKNPLESVGVIVQDVPTAEQNIKKLQAGRIDFYIDDKAVILQTLEHIIGVGHAGQFVFLNNSFSDKDEFKIMVSHNFPGSDQILAKINKGLDKINANGELKKILARYGL